MQIGKLIKTAREAKRLSQKEVALSCKMDQSHYSRVENGKTDPSFSIILRIVKALNIEITELFKADEIYKDINTFDKSLMEKVALIEQLDKKEKTAFYSVLDAFIGKKKLKDTLNSVLQNVK